MTVRKKYIHGYGPYWYEQKSIRVGSRVNTQHIRYIGKNGGGGVSVPPPF